MIVVTRADGDLLQLRLGPDYHYEMEAGSSHNFTEIFSKSPPPQETPNSSGFSKYHQLHRMTKNHWRLQSEKNKENLDKIVSSLDESLVLRERLKIKSEYVFTTFLNIKWTLTRSLRPIVKKEPRGDIPDTFSQQTIELCVITDPVLFNLVQETFNLERDVEIVEKLFSLVHGTLLQAQTFLRHSSISSAGGFNLLLNGIR